MIPGTAIKAKFSFSERKFTINPDVDTWKFKEDEIISYNMDYKAHALTMFKMNQGDTGLMFTDKEIIKKQKGVLQYMLKRIGSSLLNGSGIMNVSLPIRIFDERSLLEVFAFQLCLSPYFLEKAGASDSALERLKLVYLFS